MASVHPPPPGLRELRSFALLTGALFAGVFGFLLPWVVGIANPAWPWIVFAILAGWGLLSPASLVPVHRGWMRMAEALGRVNNRLILGIMFFAVITPAGFLRRLAGDPMTRRIDRQARTYRKPKTRRSRESMERPF